MQKFSCVIQGEHIKIGGWMMMMMMMKDE